VSDAITRHHRISLLAFVACALATTMAFFAAPVSAAPDPRAIASLAMDPTYQALGDRHIAAGMGLPLFVTHDPTVALRQPMVILAGELSGDEMTVSLVSRLHAYVDGGGTLIINDPESTGAQELAGIKPTVVSQKRYQLKFDIASGDPGFAHLRAWQSQTIVIGNPKENSADVTQSLTPVPGSGARLVARFDDGTGAICVRTIGKGRVYALGAALFDLVVVPQNNHDPDSERWYDNHFEPSADSPQFVVRDWYMTYVRGAIALDPVPDGKTGALIFTHDVDYSLSIINMLAYARAEHARGFYGTYFIETKNVDDQADTAFFDATGKKNTRIVASLGGEIASHTVAHARDYREYPYGTGLETSSNYHPKVVAGGALVVKGKTLGGTLLGEMRVSKAYLEAAVPGIHVDAYRSGYLYIHPRQFEALMQTGYRFDSSFTANDVLTDFPFRELEDNSYTKESTITEFPILITDSQLPMLPLVPHFEQVLDDESVFHGVSAVLIHPDVIADKLPTELALYDHYKNRFWVGGVDAFGEYWLRRARVTLATSFAGDVETVRVTSPDGMKGLTLDTGPAMSISSVQGTTAVSADAGRSVILGTLAPGQTAVLELAPLKQAAGGASSTNNRHATAPTAHVGMYL
jgi:hypothetical protein